MFPKPRPMNNQEAFNNVWQHFVVERNPPCVIDGGWCALRNTDQHNGCAIGCQIPQTLVNLAGESGNTGTSIASLIEEYDAYANYFTHVTSELLQELQQAHDDWSDRLNDSPESALSYLYRLVERLRNLASKWHLEVPA